MDYDPFHDVEGLVVPYERSRSSFRTVYSGCVSTTSHIWSETKRVEKVSEVFSGAFVVSSVSGPTQVRQGRRDPLNPSIDRP